VCSLEQVKFLARIDVPIFVGAQPALTGIRIASCRWEKMRVLQRREVYSGGS
jgi:hypothetical protein